MQNLSDLVQKYNGVYFVTIARELSRIPFEPYSSQFGVSVKVSNRLHTSCTLNEQNKTKGDNLQYPFKQMQAWHSKLPTRISSTNNESLTSFHQIRVSRALVHGGIGKGPQGFLRNSLSKLRMSKDVAQAPETVVRCLKSWEEDLPPSGPLSEPQAELCATNAECVTVEELGSVEGLARWLMERLPSEKTSIISWGVAPGTKRVMNLWKELVDGEISLEDSYPPKRTVHVASVKVRNESGLYLIESHQEMTDGRTRSRNRPLSEKMHPGENVEDACCRGVYEELGANMGAPENVEMMLETYQREEQERDSLSYPGLLTRYVLHTMVAVIRGLPATDFSTQEDEGGVPTNGGLTTPVSENGHLHLHESSIIGVKRHFWRWVCEDELAEIMRRK